MKVIVGLGNPGKKYEDTRHNAGFIAIDKINDKWGIPVVQNKFRALIGEGRIEGEKVLLVKPQTYMNLSGESIAEILKFYKLTPEDVVVIYDDLDLPPGQLRLREKGSAGGHNGIKSLILHMGTQEFKRIKIGIGRPEPGRSVSDYVLHPFSTAERPLIDEAAELAAAAAAMWTKEPFVKVMNQYNVSKKQG
ncbi:MULTISPECIES: aminoacyl-tRNA hydrolase [Brevibacillus]|uniref:aminoacyl-tRNA hydrolase n=1 Tax=Brevibacillus TaxID=55080 RepID=UPI0004F2610D|nr:aminoacyl-tRNA hydrolase [Brevibacillus borstelensis]KKX52775.1 peptidyl-tRNA hydrolase [Brevibacillus borstelensis cifa_chp40]MBE5395822.1 aminoacyl-tRNA hydrolase [Brevibacillus borstelensis]MCM3472691.1 aminoacyl-tRNA hydrolase [Brevibacillus borstelensis]MCM3592713.1 aminoacyl-tRNA hydrolase [Brevibacillus borstelensis]MCM3624151.1 aminoacyl-tRNA hydrolase [Brevibacillus borstelensis]